MKSFNSAFEFVLWTEHLWNGQRLGPNLYDWFFTTFKHGGYVLPKVLNFAFKLLFCDSLLNSLQFDTKHKRFVKKYRDLVVDPKVWRFFWRSVYFNGPFIDIDMREQSDFAMQFESWLVLNV